MERTARPSLHLRAPVRGPKRLLALRSDDRLVDLVRAGDDAAFEVLYERHVAGVLGFCRHMLGSQEEAEDAVQQAFVSAHGAMRRGSREIVFKPWLYTIARNRCLSVLRARREQPSELPEISTAGLNAEVERRADLRELVADLQRLPEQQRAALVLSELGDLSHAEVAEVIGYEPHAVKGLVFRARAALAERRDARAADCGDIRLELAAATGGGLRRGRLRYHLESCPGCVAYLEEVRRQRKLLGVALPVVPALALKDSVMASVGIGAGAGAAGLSAAGGAVSGGAAAVGGSAAGGAASIGLPLLGTTAAKLAIAGVLVVGGAGVATEVVRDDSSERPASGTPVEPRQDTAGKEPAKSGAGSTGGAPGSARAVERRAGARGAERRERGQQISRERSNGKSRAGEPRGQARGLGKQGAQGRGRSSPEPRRNAGGRSETAPGQSQRPAVPPRGDVQRGNGSAPLPVVPAPKKTGQGKAISPVGPVSPPALRGTHKDG